MPLSIANHTDTDRTAVAALATNLTTVRHCCFYLAKLCCGLSRSMSESMSELSNAAQSSAPASSDTLDDNSNDNEQEKSLIEASLTGAIALAKDNNTKGADEQFKAIFAEVQSESPTSAKLLRQLWQEYVSVQRAALFWECMSDAEKELSDKMTESNVQLQRNYMRLVQEQ